MSASPLPEPDGPAQGLHDPRPLNPGPADDVPSNSFEPLAPVDPHTRPDLGEPPAKPSAEKLEDEGLTDPRFLMPGPGELAGQRIAEPPHAP